MDPMQARKLSQLVWGSTLALMLGVAGPGASEAGEEEPAWFSHVQALAAAEPSARRDAAPRVGSDEPLGPRLAMVLADVALSDADAGVRAAAEASLERLAGAALETYAGFYKDVHLGEHPTWRTVSDEVANLGARITATDVAAALSAASSDAEQAQVLGVLPQVVGTSTTRTPGVQGIDVILGNRIDHGGPATQRMARAGLVMWAMATLRDAGRSPAPATTALAGMAASLLERARSKRVPLADSACAVLGALAPPSAEVADALLVTQGGLHATPLALARLGPAIAKASPVAVDAYLNGLLKQQRPSVAYVLARIGSKQAPWLKPPAEIEAALREGKLGPADVDTLHETARVALEIGRADRSRQAEARGALGRLALGLLKPEKAPGADVKTGLLLRTTLEALAGLGSLTAAERARMEQRVEGQEPSVEGPLRALLAAEGEGAGAHAARLLVLLQPRERQAWTSPWIELLPQLGPSVAQACEATMQATAPQGPIESSLLAACATALMQLPQPTAERASLLQSYVEGKAGGWLRRVGEGSWILTEFPRTGISLAYDFVALRAVVDALGACGSVAKPALATLDGLRRHPDVRLAWRVERARTALEAP